jgi:hypothetical protein
MTPADALLAANIAANLATETANMAQEAAYAAQAAAEAVRAAQAAQATASSSTRNYAVVPEIPVRLLRSRRGFLRIPKFRMSGKPRKQPKAKARQTNKRNSGFPMVDVQIPSRSPSPEAMHSSRRQRISYALPVPLIGAVPMDTRTQGGRRTDRKKTKKQKKHRRKL